MLAVCIITHIVIENTSVADRMAKKEHVTLEEIESCKNARGKEMLLIIQFTMCSNV